MKRPTTLLTILVGPAGSGKTTFCQTAVNTTRISQDDQGKEEHLKLFKKALERGENIVVDRMNFNKIQRERYISLAKEEGYTIECIVLHENRATCLARMKERVGHPTIMDDKSAGSALNTFFKGYERPTEDEGFDKITFVYPKNREKDCVVVDIDNTIANGRHRQHYVQNCTKKNWKAFLSECDKDTPKLEVIESICYYLNGYADFHKSMPPIVICSGRGDEYRAKTLPWLDEHFPIADHVFMRERGDYRKDFLIKEILLDFEIYTRYENVKIWFDDRVQVIEKIRSRDILVFQVANGDF